MSMTGIVLSEFAHFEPHAITARKILAPRAWDRMGTGGAMIVKERCLPLGVEDGMRLEGGTIIPPVGKGRLLQFAESTHFVRRHGAEAPRYGKAFISAPSTDESAHGERSLIILGFGQEGLRDLHWHPFSRRCEVGPRRRNRGSCEVKPLLIGWPGAGTPPLS